MSNIKTLTKARDALAAILRAPSVGSNGPGSSTIVVQDFNLRAVREAAAAIDALPQSSAPNAEPAAGASPVEPTVRQRKCSRPRCDGHMLPGVAMGQTYAGVADFQGREVVTLSPRGPGVVVPCLKCNACGHSVSAQRCR